MNRYKGVNATLHLTICCLLLAFGTVIAQDDTSPSEELTPYEQIVGAATSVDEGGITVYEAEDQYFAEIPESALDRDLLWYAEIGAAPPGASLILGFLPNTTSLSGQDGRMVRLERQGERIFVLDFTTSATRRSAFPDSPEPSARGEELQTGEDVEKINPVDIAVGRFSQPSIILAFDIVAESPAGNPLINLNAVFGSDVPQFSVSNLLAGTGNPVIQVDPARSFVTRVSSYEENLFVTNLLTFVTATGDAVSIETKHTLLLLPTEPMLPRLFDPRVGYFNLTFTEFDEDGAESQNYILRHRLERQDPAAEISDPVEPIVYYLGPGVPDKWRSYIKEGVENWNIAFEAAGFSNAVVVRDAPSPAEDTEWDPGDARYSVIRWLAEPAANAQGPSLYDPRTGEIISNHILIWGDVLDLAADWYYSMAGAVDPAAQSLPLPEETIGAMMGYIVAHEVGHALGLRHNQKASTAYSVAQLRDPYFTCANGSTASIMAYGRLNYVAQPEDGVPAECLLPRVGPYDIHAIEWGYKPVEGAMSPQAEREALDALASRIEEAPALFWIGDEEQDGLDPYVLTQNIGGDRVEATRLGLDNLERLMATLPEAVVIGEGAADSARLAKAYRAIAGQWNSIVSSVPRLIGGVVHTPSFDLNESQYHFVSAAEQREAVAFLNNRVFTDLEPYLQPELMARLGGAGVTNLFVVSQRTLLVSLLTPERLQRLSEAELRSPQDAYAPEAYLRDLQTGLFAELQGDGVKISNLRRGLQYTYLATLASLLSPPSVNAEESLVDDLGIGISGDVWASIRSALTQLKIQLLAASGRAVDEQTANHLRQLEVMVDDLLRP